MNALRRDALLRLEQEITGRFRREQRPQDGDGETRRREEAAPAFGAAVENAPQLWASAEDPALLPVLLEEAAVTGVYLPLDRIPPEDWESWVTRCHAAGKQAVFALPHVLRKESADFLRENEPLWRAAKPDWWLIRSLDEAGFLTEREAPGLRIFDAGLYTWNREAVRRMRSLGADILTLPYEQRLEEWKERGIGPEDEMVVYGRIPLMVSAQCTGKTTGHCRRQKAAGEALYARAEFRHLADRKNAVFLEDPRCRFCYTVIYNSVPLWLPDRVPAEVRRVRFAFTDETPEEAREILRGAAAGQFQKPDAFTRGHFARGVE